MRTLITISVFVVLIIPMCFMLGISYGWKGMILGVLLSLGAGKFIEQRLKR